MSSLTVRELSLLWLLWSVATTLNLTKAYHIDDPFHLTAAQWIVEEPLRPMSGVANWGGTPAPFHSGNHPPLFFYLMAAWGAVFGFGEVAMHALLSVFTALALFFFLRLAKVTMGADAIWGTGLFALSPGFLVNQNMMLDVPLTALLLGALFHGVLALRKGGRHLLWASCFMGSAVLVKYTAIAVLPVLFFLAVRIRGPVRWSVLIPIAVLIAWSCWNLVEFGEVHLFSRLGQQTAPLRLGQRAYSWLMTLGSISPWALVLTAPLWPLGDRSCRALAFAVLVLYTTIMASGLSGVIGGGAADAWLLTLFMAGGVFSLWHLVRTVLPVLQKRDVALQLQVPVIAAALLLGAFVLFFAPWMATRHLLPVVPLLLLLSGPALHKLSAQVKVFTLLLTAFIGAGLALSDRGYAAFHAEQARKLAEADPPVKWYAGSMGWGWYAASQGMRDLHASSEEVRAGDLVAIPVHAPVPPLPPGWHTRQVALLEQPIGNLDRFSTRHWMRFYSADHPVLPWRISTVDRERIAVLELVPIGADAP